MFIHLTIKMWRVTVVGQISTQTLALISICSIMQDSAEVMELAILGLENEEATKLKGLCRGSVASFVPYSLVSRYVHYTVQFSCLVLHCTAFSNRIDLFQFAKKKPTPETLREDGLAVGTHILTNLGVNQLIIHGESIGGVAASATARQLSASSLTSSQMSLLICDRTFCNLEATAQRLVGGWSGYAIRMLAPLWSTDVARDFVATACPKVVANDAADMIIFDSASLKSGVAYWKEIYRGIASTKGIGWMMDAPIHYRMAVDYENVCVAGTHPRTKELVHEKQTMCIMLLTHSSCPRFQVCHVRIRTKNSSCMACRQTYFIRGRILFCSMCEAYRKSGFARKEKVCCC